MGELLIQNARIIDAKVDFAADILIKDGVFSRVGINLSTSGEVIDAKGLAAMSAFLDLHAHFRDPGLTEKEDLLSGCRAAAAGGYTYVNLMANTKPVVSSGGAALEILRRAREIGLCEVHQTVSITENFDGETTEHLKFLPDEVLFISDDGRGVMKNETMLRAMEIARAKELIVCSHTEDMDLSAKDYRVAENLMTARDLVLSQATNAHLHLCHVSTKEAIGYVGYAKSLGMSVTCEVTPHHIALFGDCYRVNPPIREEADLKALIAALRSGVCDCISTDHAPHTAQDKENGAPGMSGLETAFPVSYTTLCRENGFGLSELSRVMSERPARIAGRMKGRILEGWDGDLALIDLEKKYKIDPGEFFSKGKNTPFAGKEVYGEVAATIYGGKVVYRKK